MKILVACEFSGVVRDAFAARGHDAWSCDLLPSERPGNHYQGDIRDLIKDSWDLMIAHTPCTYLCNSGVRWLYEEPERWKKLIADAVLFRDVMSANIPHIAMENPIMHQYATQIIGRNYDQIIQPWQFGHDEQKATCLWLKNLSPLKPTKVVEGREQRIWKMSRSEKRGMERSRTFTGIAEAMAEQWSVVRELGVGSRTASTVARAGCKSRTPN